MEKDIKMNVDILTPLRWGGPQKWGDNLSESLLKKGIYAKNIHSFFGIIKRIFYTKADVIHSTLPLFFTFHKKPIILTIHGDFNNENKIWKFFYKIAIKKSLEVTVPSKWLKHKLGLSHAKIIPNGIFIKNQQHNKRLTIKKSTNNKLLFVTVTGFKFIEKSKGILRILNLLNQLNKFSNLIFRYHIIGGGRYLEKIKKKSGITNFKKVFHGYKSNPKVFFSKSDIFLYYSFQDNLPLAIIEAMSYGLPVITNNIGAVNELITNGKDGFISKNDEDYLDKIKLLLTNLGQF